MSPRRQKTRKTTTVQTKRGVYKGETNRQVTSAHVSKSRPLPISDTLTAANSPIEKIRNWLSSPRLHPDGTIDSYMQTTRRLINYNGHAGPPSEDDFRHYFTWRRQNDISERTLNKEFHQFPAICQANGWKWPFTGHDAPDFPETETRPAHWPEDIEHVIMARDKLTKGERFYLAVATTWGPRREELARIKKRDFDTETFIIDTAKHGVKKKHLIPEELKPVFSAYNPSQITRQGLSAMYHRICIKTGVQVDKGWGWHNIRETVAEMIDRSLAKNDHPAIWRGDYMGWTRSTSGRKFAGFAMASTYHHPEIHSNDPWYQEREMIRIHPFLHCWAGNNQADILSRANTTLGSESIG